MLTKLEVHGFKNLLNFELHLGSFTCLAGLNGVGKSNIFDAIKFLSLLSNDTIMDAAQKVRDSDSSSPEDIFWTDGESSLDEIFLAAEMLINKEVHDDFGREATATSTFLRYEVKIAKNHENSNGATRASLFLSHEQLDYFTKHETPSHILFPHSASLFRQSTVMNKRRGKSYISTSRDGDIIEIRLHQDDGSRGKPQTFPAEQAPKTVLANTNNNAWPTILAARREMLSWRFLALEPSAMRRSNNMYDPQKISTSGDYLASTFQKLLKKDLKSKFRVSQQLSTILPVSGVRLDTNEIRQLLTIEVKERSGAYLPTRALSDGTLRFLTLCIMAEDSDFEGLLCFEEPENGIHPAKMREIYDLLTGMSVDTHDVVNEENPMRQVIIATHSPTMVQLQNEEDLVYVESVKTKGPNGLPTNTLRTKSLHGTWRSKESGKYISKASIGAYLSLPKDAQIKLEI
ncbi:AAA family ATPase [Halomonas sp. M4R1S46]|uniref:AAA family ATPase n=1 Tax=Halomonas sp. M4R1S46 TaxID=2982692 RepID=UPI0021E46759|nr:AAA family ATPase [Halomonas sp. M4R1S46]UYG07541.1 AAA family ATPase [Halomonas sp. M4R1S46]